MKLNLVPTYVSKERQALSSVFGAVAIACIGIGIAVFFTISSKKALESARADNEEAKPKAQAALDTSLQADTIIASAAQLIKNANLAQEMVKHNDVYPDFYTQDIIPYIPPFFRLTNLSASPVDATTSTVTMVGTLKTYQQYADLVLALMRIKGAVSVGRNGFTGERFMVPAITPEDQIGRYKKVNDPSIPDDPLQRLAYYEAQGTPPTGYLAANNFGSATPDTRGATPEESLITIQLTVRKDLRTPDPRATMRSSGGGGATTAGLPGGAFGPPSGAFGPPGGAGGASATPPPAAPDTTTPKSSGKKSKGGDDE